MPNVTAQVEKDELRELDKRIAHEVMGLAPCDSWRQTNLGSAGGAVLMRDGNCEHGDGSTCYPRIETGSIHGPIGGVPRYSSSVEAAMQVVQKMDEQKWCVWIISQSRKGPKWAVSFEAKDSDEGNAAGDSLPEAICRAALSAIEGKQN